VFRTQLYVGQKSYVISSGSRACISSSLQFYASLTNESSLDKRAPGLSPSFLTLLAHTSPYLSHSLSIVHSIETIGGDENGASRADRSACRTQPLSCRITRARKQLLVGIARKTVVRRRLQTTWKVVSLRFRQLAGRNGTSSLAKLYSANVEASANNWQTSREPRVLQPQARARPVQPRQP
jgi:hypothetical protein